MKLVNYEQNERLNTVNGEFRPTINAEAYGLKLINKKIISMLQMLLMNLIKK